MYNEKQYQEYNKDQICENQDNNEMSFYMCDQSEDYPRLNSPNIPFFPGTQPQYPDYQPSGPGFGGPPQYPDYQQSGPGFGGPPQYPSYQPSGPGIGKAPTSPPPSVVPQQSPQLKAVDPGSIRGCLFRYTYVWPRFGRPYWFFPTNVGRRSVSGYRWNGYRWFYFGTDLNSIRSFTCY